VTQYPYTVQRANLVLRCAEEWRQALDEYRRHGGNVQSRSRLARAEIGLRQAVTAYKQSLDAEHQQGPADAG
jgi:hypothetical protein